jgi:hypothetical protein
MIKFLKNYFKQQKLSKLAGLRIKAKFLRQINGAGQKTSSYYLDQEIAVLQEIAELEELWK